MKEKSLKYLSDILIAIDLIEDFTDGILEFYEYETDFKTQSAVERQLGIIGEALNQFRKIEPTIGIIHERQIVAFRNRLIHSYDGIDNSIVWAILKKQLAPLQLEIKILTLVS